MAPGVGKRRKGKIGGMVTVRRNVTMRRKIALLVAATTSAVIIAFLIPLGMLVRTLAEDRAIAGASQEAQGVATVVAGVSAGIRTRRRIGPGTINRPRSARGQLSVIAGPSRSGPRVCRSMTWIALSPSVTDAECCLAQRFPARS